MRTEIRWKAIHRITHGRLIHTMATCRLCSENRRSETLRRPHKQDRAERRETYGGLINEYCACSCNHRRTA
jgi:hypothetical protein